MSATVGAPVGSVRVVAVGEAGLMARGRPAEFRHRGLSLAARPTAVGALLEIGKDPDSVVLVPTDMRDMPLLEFVDVVRSLTHVPVIAGLTLGCESEVVSDLFDHGVARTVSLPVTPTRLAEAVIATRAPERAEQLVHRVGNLTLDEVQHRVTWHGDEVRLGRKDFEILRYLIMAHPRAVPLRELVHEFEDDTHEHSIRVRVAVGRMRARFADAAPRRDAPIETVHRIGYRLLRA